MNVQFHKNFSKQYKILSVRQQNKFKARVKLFLLDEFNPTLINHPLKGKYLGYISINVTGDIRAVYKKETADTVIFVVICSYSQLYK